MGPARQRETAAAPHVADWVRLASRAPTTRDIAALRAHPNSAELLRRWVSKALAFHDQDVATTASHPDAAIIMFGNLALLLHGTGGLTHTRLREASAAMKLTSPGRASAILSRLRRIGYIVPARHRGDGTVGLYVPTPKMLADYRKRFRIGMEAVAETVEPGVDLALDRLEEEAVFVAILVRFAFLTRAAFADIPKDLTAFYALVERNAAMQIVMSLLTGIEPKHGFPTAGIAPLSVSALSKRFGISRTQVRRHLAKMEAAGFIERRAGGAVRIAPRLCRAFENYFFRIALGLAAIAHCTIADLQPV